ncbi:MAG TPA: sugar phosphate nucleotidyltransferase [Pyrinomonadaceae bacterium]|nr:sugar phosphate nucleotidyltransferase [Pyrinomonadaceae bacterium]
MKVTDIKFALSKVISTNDSDLEQRCARLSRLCDLFLERYGDGPVSLLRAPARIDVLGEHIDYVSYMPTASLTFGSQERNAFMLYRKSAEPEVRSVSSNVKYEPSSFPLAEVEVPQFGQNVESEWLSFLFKHGTPAPHWQNYIQSAVSFARGKFGGRVTNGFDFALDSNIPAGGGASSSSALVVLGGAAIREVNAIPFTLKELAQDSALAEWYVGTRGGSMDHITICLAQSASGVLIKYSTGQTRRISLPDKPFAWITFFSKPADKGREIMIEYNERAAVSRLLIPAVIRKWKNTDAALHSRWVESLASFETGSSRELDIAEDILMMLPTGISIDTLRDEYPETFSELERSFPALLNAQSRWPLQLRARALHHLGEVRRVAEALHILESLENGSTADAQFSAMQKIGKLLDQSHASLRDLYEVSTQEVEQLTDVIRSNPHVLGARLMGGGFGGNILALTTREHSQALIEKVQEQYYAPQQRDGAGEGSVMVSTPGDGLAHIDLHQIWRELIAHLNSLGPNSESYADKLRSLIDSSTLQPNSAEIWPVIVAAGKGTRATASGLDLPKPLALVGKKPAIVHVLKNIRKALGQTRAPIIIVSAENETMIRQALAGEEVIVVLQPGALGTGDAVLQAHTLMQDFTGLALVVWSTQPVIREKTYERTVKLAALFSTYEMFVPTTFRKHPYAPIERDESGAVRSAAETYLESADQIDFGETNIGMFVLKKQAMFDALLELKNRYWNKSTGRYERSRGELGFPNELINAFASQHTVFACPIADWREEQGIKQLSDLAVCEQFISELEAEKASQRLQ